MLNCGEEEEVTEGRCLSGSVRPLRWENSRSSGKVQANLHACTRLSFQPQAPPNESSLAGAVAVAETGQRPDLPVAPPSSNHVLSSPAPLHPWLAGVGVGEIGFGHPVLWREVGSDQR